MKNTSPRIYVGTYGKYNSGSIAGQWLDLADYNTYDELMKACSAIHKDESDPEFMIQDCENMPDGLTLMETISEQEFNDIKLAMKEEQQEEQGKPAINIIQYNERCFAVVGETYPVRTHLKNMGGVFNKRLSCGAGWIFSNVHRQSVEAFISGGEVATAVKNEKSKVTKDGEQFVAWLKEYADKGGDEYYIKNSVGAIKMHDRYYLLGKPHIETRFCFHDEGWQYEYYKQLSADDNKMAKYFKSENLEKFDKYIDHINCNKDKGYENDGRVWWLNIDYDKNRLDLQFYNDGYESDKLTACTEEEKELILKGLKFARKCFEARLDAYLKRYGVSKLHTWTYWADA